MINLEFDSIIFQEGNTYVAYSPKLDVSSCGGTVDEARNNLKTAVGLFLEEAENRHLRRDSERIGYEKGRIWRMADTTSNCYRTCRGKLRPHYPNLKYFP